MSNKLINDDYTRDFEKKSEEQYEEWLKPAIYIGLGGFGCNVVRSIKKIAREHIGDKLLSTLGFIGVDTHDYEPRRDVLTKEEYVELAPGALPNKLAANDPEVLDWFLDLTKHWNATSIDGANMVRAVGRLAFINSPSHTDFMNALGQIHNRVSQFKNSNNLMIYIISSVAGGTGAGAFLDAFASVREYFAPKLGGQVKIQAYLATPEPLENVAPSINLPRFYANTYASLKELYHLATGNMFTVRYKSGILEDTVTISSFHLPDSIFLISNGNEYDRKIVETYDQLGQLVATYLLLDVLTPLQKSSSGPEVHRGENVIRDMTGNSDMLRIVSSLGTAKFGFPYEEIVEYYNYNILSNYLDIELSFKKDILQDARHWILDNEISEYKSDDLQHTLLETPQGDSIRILLNIESDFEDVKREKLMKRASDLVLEKENAVKLQIDGLLKQNFDNLFEKCRNSFRDKLEALLSEYSVGSAHQFIRLTKEEIKTHLNSLQEELKDTKSEIGKEKERIESAIGNIGVAAESGFFGRRVRIRAAIGSFQTELQLYLDSTTKLHSQEVGVSLYEKILDFIEEQQLRYERLIETIKARKNYIRNKFYNLQNLLEKLSDKYNRKSGNRFSFAKIAHIHQLYSELFDTDTETAILNYLKKQLRDNGSLLDSLSLDEEWIKIVSGYVIPKIESRLNGLDMMGLLQRFYADEEDKKALMSFLASISAPLYPLDPTLRENSYQTVWIIAGEDSIRDQLVKLFKPFIPPGDGIQLASSKNKYEIIIYTVRHGYTLHSNSRITTYKSNYDKLQTKYLEGIKRKRIAVPPIHCFPDAWTWDEIYPSLGEEEGNLYFILGRAFSYIYPTYKTEDGNRAFIYHRGRFYYLIDENHEVRLGDGLEEALETFISRPDLIDIIKAEIDAKIQTEGVQNVQPKLKDYLTVLNGDISKSSGDRLLILEDLRKELSKYIKEMQSTVV